MKSVQKGMTSLQKQSSAHEAARHVYLGGVTLAIELVALHTAAASPRRVEIDNALRGRAYQRS